MAIFNRRLKSSITKAILLCKKEICYNKNEFVIKKINLESKIEIFNNKNEFSITKTNLR